MGATSRTKGARGEREVVQLALAAGLTAERTWQTAQSSDPTVRACDVLVAGLRAQVKLRRSGFGSLYEALSDVDALFVRQDGAKWLAVLPADRLLALLANVEPLRSAKAAG